LSNVTNNEAKSPSASSEKISLDNPEYFLNRELSWIRFNARVLEEARDLWHPLLERVKFIAICGSNLDEFFMTRAARLIKKVKKSSDEKSMDGMTAMEQILATRKEILPLIKNHSECWKTELLPALAREDIRIREFAELSERRKESMCEYFKKSILPLLEIQKEGISSSAIGNLQINLLVSGFVEKDSHYLLEIPTDKIGRLIRIPRFGYSSGSNKEIDGLDYEFIFAEDLFANCLHLIFPNEKSLTAHPFRLTRNGEIDILMDESSDFLNLVKKSLTSRKSGFPTRLEFSRKMPSEIRQEIASSLGLPEYFTYEIDGPLGFVDLWQLHKLNRPDIKDKSFLPSISPLLTPDKNIFATIARRDFVLYHPYDGFEVIIDLLKEAAEDRFVTEICITMYRMDHKSPIVEALIEAARRGKQVKAIIELKAKFDEENNILLASKLRDAGINTIYNFPNFKVHAKLCLITRRLKSGTVRYSHIGSGNYNAITAKIYGDLGYLTAREDVGKELASLFEVLVSGLQEREEEFRNLLVAPKTLKNEILKRIDREIEFHKKTGKGYLAFKLNNLEEKDIIKSLYKASMAGIRIDLNVRGLCCLRPGIPGISNNISVISIVGRFLEHARIYYFRDGEHSDVLVGSSDLMFRNLNERVEVLFSVPDPRIRSAILEYMLNISLRDNVKARKLLSDGTYERVLPRDREELINSQNWLIQNRGVWHER
jgi:polyphosphate kinase